MRTIYVSIAFLFTLLCNNAFAQSHIIYGSFEPLTNITTCSFVFNTTYATTNLFNGNGAEFSTIYSGNPGDTGTVQLNTVTCSDSHAPVAGGWFIHMQWKANGTADAISLKLSQPMTVGHQYQLLFFANADTTHLAATSAKVTIGCSTDSIHMGTVLHTFPEPVPSFATWTPDTLLFTATSAASWITVKADATTQNFATLHYVDLDTFSLKDLTAAAGINEVTSATGSMHLYPNPATNATTLTLDDNVALPARMIMYDITGRVIKTDNALNNNKTTISRDNLKTGMYFIKVLDNNNNTFADKLLIE